MSRDAGKRGFEIRGAANDEDVARANDVMAKTQEPRYWESMQWLRETGPRWPGFRREHTRIAFEGNEIVGALRILTLTLRIGKARLKTGGIGWVSTVPSHRNRGVCRAMMLDALEYLEGNGYHMSLLFGVPDLYHKFGYVTAIPDYSVVCDVSSLAEFHEPTVVTRTVQSNDLRTITRMHQQADSDTSCSVVRDARYFDTLFHCRARTIPLWPAWDDARALVDRTGRMLAYVMPQHSGGELHVKEIELTKPETCPMAVGACVQLATGAGASRIRFHVPPNHAIAYFLRDYECVQEARYFRNREGMLRATNVINALRAMIPEWRRILERNRLADVVDRIPIAVDSQKLNLVINHGEITVEPGAIGAPVRLSNQELCRLLAGFSTSRDGGVRIPGTWSESRKRLLDALFPPRYPFVWPIDHF